MGAQRAHFLRKHRPSVSFAFRCRFRHDECVRNWITIAALLSVLEMSVVACKGSSTSSSATGSTTGSTTGSSASGSAPVLAIDAATLSGPMAIVVDAAPAASACKPKCLYAAELPLADAIAKHAAECKAAWYAADDCEGLLYARNCIYAAYGNVFKTAAWKDRFTKEPWYKPKPTFVEKDIPAVAMANIKELKKQYEACAAPVPAVTPEDKKLADETYERVIIKEEGADGIDADDLAVVRENHRNLYVHEKTTYEYSAAPKDGRRTITMSGLFWAVGGGEFKADESATLTFEGEKLVEIR